MATRAPASTCVCNSPGRPISVNTARWWSASLDQYTGWNAWAMVSSLVWSRPSDTLGTEISTVGA